MYSIMRHYRYVCFIGISFSFAIFFFELEDSWPVTDDVRPFQNGNVFLQDIGRDAIRTGRRITSAAGGLGLCTRTPE